MSVQNVQIDCTVSPLRVISVNYGNPGLPGPPGPTAVSTDTGNAARLGSDSLIFVPPGGVPGPHQATHHTGGADQIPVATPSSTGLVPVLPNVATQYLSGTGTWSTPGGGTPAPHAATHNLGGSDAVAPDWSQVQNKPATFPPTPGPPQAHATSHLDNGTDVIPVVTTTRTGLVPKLSGTVTTFLNGTGSFSTPAGGGGGDMTKAVYDINNDGIVDQAAAVPWTGVTGKPATFAPSAHATSHESGGADPIPLDTLGAPTDITTLNASLTAHGLLPKLGGGTGNFLRADGTWASPPAGGGGGDMLKSVYDVNNDSIVDHAALSDTAPWTGITGKPATFPPDATAELIVHKGAVSGYASLDAGIKVPVAQLPAATATVAGIVPTPPNNTTTFLRGDATFATPTGIVPSAHGSTHAGGGTDPVPIATTTVAGLAPAKPNAGVNATTTQVVMGDDTRLSDARTPTAHQASHVSGADQIPLPTTTVKGLCPPLDGNTAHFLSGAGTCIAPPAAAPAAHASTHEAGGSDTIPLDTLAAPTDITTLNASTSAHGLMPKANGSANSFYGSDATQKQVTYAMLGGSQPGPVAHAASHVTTGQDQIALPTTTQRGLAPPIPATNPLTQFHRGDNTFAPANYPDLTNIPATFAPSGHGSTHLSAGSDPIALATTAAAGLCPPPDGTTIQITGGKLVGFAWAPKYQTVTNGTGTTTIDCVGATSISILCNWTSAGGALVLALQHVGPGVPITLAFTNNFSSAVTYAITATDPSNTAFNAVTAAFCTTTAGAVPVSLTTAQSLPASNGISYTAVTNAGSLRF